MATFNFPQIQGRLAKRLPTFLMVLLILQPILDVVSYFFMEWGDNTVTTYIRFVMFAVVFVYSFLISDRKNVYILFCSVVAIYWLLHMANCFRIGYQSFFQDTAYFLRVIQMPLWTLSFITFFRKCRHTPELIQWGFVINYLLIILVLLLNVITGKIEYTYSYPFVGIIGWFGVSSAQSAINVILVPLILYRAYRSGSKLFFGAALVCCYSVLYVCGTRFDFYSIFLISLAMIIVLALNLKKAWFHYGALVLAMVVCFALKDYSPMMELRTAEQSSWEETQEEIDMEIQEPDDEDPSEETPRLTYEQYDKLYRPTYGDVIDRFGIERVAKQLNYTTSASTLADNRLLKKNVAAMVWEDSDFLTHCFGYEYMSLIMGDEIYDLENDFPSLFYFYGYVGFALYMAFLFYFFGLILVSLIRRFKKTMCVESGAVGIMLALLMGGALYTGHILRHPNVCVYMSIALAYVYYLTVIKGNVSPFFGRGTGRPERVGPQPW